MPYPPTEIVETIDAISEQYDELLNRRIDLLVELDDIGKQMDQMLLTIARLQDDGDDPSEDEPCQSNESA